MTQATHHILIIEDEPAIRDVLRVLLEPDPRRPRYLITETGLG